MTFSRRPPAPTTKNCRRYWLETPGCAAAGAVAVVVGAKLGLIQQAWTRAFRLSGDLGSILPCRTTHRNVAWIWPPGSQTDRTGRDGGTRYRDHRATTSSRRGARAIRTPDSPPDRSRGLRPRRTRRFSSCRPCQARSADCPGAYPGPGLSALHWTGLRRLELLTTTARRR